VQPLVGFLGSSQVATTGNYIGLPREVFWSIDFRSCRSVLDYFPTKEAWVNFQFFEVLQLS